MIRDYCESDARAVGILIADTFSKFNLAYASPGERLLLLGPFRHARSEKQAHRERIAETIRAEMVFVADNDREIIGVIRGRTDRLQSLFVREDHHRQGIGRGLVERLESECWRQGATQIRLAATLYAVPFYTRLGYKKSTGLRSARIFNGSGFKYQPMKKVFPDTD
jgi:GNAT superfamily N-acetyltransferase